MISHEYRSIFIHQRKCAGSSIIHSFGIQPDDEEWHFMNNGVLSPEYHSAPNGYFRFAVVRNPWDRFISGWKYCTSTRHRTLRDVLSNLPDERLGDGHDYRHLTRPQHAILYDEDGRLIVDYLVRFESLQQDLDLVCDLIGKPKSVLNHHNQRVTPQPLSENIRTFDMRRVLRKVGHVMPQSKNGKYGNGSAHKHYSEYFDGESQRLFMSHFGRDVELFGYQF